MKNITRGITCYSYNFGVIEGTMIKNVATMESYNKFGEREIKRRCKDCGKTSSCIQSKKQLTFTLCPSQPS